MCSSEIVVVVACVWVMEGVGAVRIAKEGTRGFSLFIRQRKRCLEVHASHAQLQMRVQEI